MDKDYLNRFFYSAHRCTLYPLVWFFQSHRHVIRVLKLSPPLHDFTLTVIPKGTRPPLTQTMTIMFPLLVLPVLPSYR
jgi:hypothetical protein